MISLTNTTGQSILKLSMRPIAIDYLVQKELNLVQNPSHYVSTNLLV